MRRQDSNDSRALFSNAVVSNLISLRHLDVLCVAKTELHCFQQVSWTN
jgi:hypothetical protein